MQTPQRRSPKSIWFWCVIPCLAALPASAAPPVATSRAHPGGLRQSTPLSVDADQAQVIQLKEPAKTVFVANPDVADVQVPSPTSFLVYGKKPGTTTVFAISEAGATMSYTVRVTRPVGEIAGAIRNAVPTAQVRVSGAPARQYRHPRQAGAIPGARPERERQHRRGDTAANPLNLGGNFGALIAALDAQGLATILAEPSLTAISDETANFLAGGEFPIPVPQGNQVTTIQYKNFGVSVDFTPTVLNANRITRTMAAMKSMACRFCATCRSSARCSAPPVSSATKASW